MGVSKHVLTPSGAGATQSRSVVVHELQNPEHVCAHPWSSYWHVSELHFQLCPSLPLLIAEPQNVPDPSHCSPGSTSPLPHEDEQSLSKAELGGLALQPGPQNPSSFMH